MDISKYTSVSEFYKDSKALGYSVPLPMCAGLSGLMKNKGLNFQEAYDFLLEKELIILEGKLYIYNLSADNL